mgnify:CR=1 FL=1
MQSQFYFFPFRTFVHLQIEQRVISSCYLYKMKTFHSVLILDRRVFIFPIWIKISCLENLIMIYIRFAIDYT